MATNTALDLSQFKAPGVYSVEFDASQYTTIQSNTLRLIVGFSRKGVYNRPVLLQDRKEALAIFGDIDTLLESRGSFFHRSIQTALNAGPVLALALLPTNNGQDQVNKRDEVEYKGFSVAFKEKNSRTGKELYSAFYDKETFWKADKDSFKAILANDPVSIGKYLGITNLGQKPISVLIRKYKENGFNLTAREFYGAGNVPSFVKDFDYISDYFVEVLVIEGDWEDSHKLAIDPTYSKYFTSKGIKKSELENFLGNVTSLGRFRGCLIPDFVDGNGINRSIDTMLNSNMLTTGIFAFIDTEALSDYANKADSDPTFDLIGHQIAEGLLDEDSTPITEIEFLSYRQNLTNVKTYASVVTANSLANTLSTSNVTDVRITSQYFTDDKGIVSNQIKIKKPLSSNIGQTAGYVTLHENLKKGTAIINGYNTASNTTTSTFFNVTEVYERNELDTDGSDATFLYVTVRNKNKKTEKTDLVYGFEETNLTANTITVTNTFPNSGAVQGAEIYFKPKTTEYTGFYAKVKTLTRDVPNSKATLVLSGTSDTLNALSASNVNYDVVIGNYYPLQTLSNATTLTYTLEYSTAPNHKANVASNDYTSIDAYVGTDIYADYTSGTLSNGDKTTTGKYIKYEKVEDTNGLPIVRSTYYTSNTLSTLNQTSSPANGGTFTINTGAESISEDIAIIAGSLSTDQKSVKLSAINGKEVTVNDYLATKLLEGGVYKYYLTKILSKVKNSDGTYTITTNNQIYIKLDTGVEYIVKVKNLEDFANNYSWFNLEGFTMTSYHLPGTQVNKQSQLAKIIGVLQSNGLFKALTDNNLLPFRYLVDTFDGGLAANSYPKNIMTMLAKSKQKCLAIMNAPSIKDFKVSTDPRFTDEPDPANGNPKPNLDVMYIRDGGNLSLAPTSIYSLPTEEEGSKFAGFFIDYPTVQENGKIFSVPPAASISNLYVNKFKNGSQYQIVAGPNRGVISVPNGTGQLEYTFNDTDRGYLSEKGLNPLIFRKGVGIMIYDDLMAYQVTRSAFNNLSLRDLLITIEEGIEQILFGFMFDANDDFTRSEIEKKVRVFLQNIQSNRGIYAFNVQIDSKNNPGEIIDQGIAILDVDVEPTKGAKIFINRVTVRKTGGIASSTGFV